MKKLTVLTGAGISAESGLKTFRDSNGLWEEYDVMQVASIEGWNRDPELVLRFYNDRRKQLEFTEPNRAHIGLAELEQYFKVSVITQNVDNLHEKAGSSQVLHLHGELTKACSVENKNLVKDIGYRDINPGETGEDGKQLRPYIVWFGEAVPAIDKAIPLVKEADYLAVIGTSLNVYPAAGLLDLRKPGSDVYIIDPKKISISIENAYHIKENAGTGIDKLIKILLND